MNETEILKAMNRIDGQYLDVRAGIKQHPAKLYRRPAAIAAAVAAGAAVVAGAEDPPQAVRAAMVRARAAANIFFIVELLSIWFISVWFRFSSYRADLLTCFMIFVCFLFLVTYYTIM